jgi:hypothetical protein
MAERIYNNSSGRDSFRVDDEVRFPLGFGLWTKTSVSGISSARCRSRLRGSMADE